MEEEKKDISENSETSLTDNSKKHLADLTDNSEKHLFDDHRNVNRLLTLFFTSVILLFIFDFFVHKHSHFPWENWPAFYAVFGFAACVLLVLVSRFILRPLVKRKENYYE